MTELKNGIQTPEFSIVIVTQMWHIVILSILTVGALLYTWSFLCLPFYTCILGSLFCLLQFLAEFLQEAQFAFGI